MTKQINEENIRVAAYYIWQNAGCPQGAENDCWLKACEQLFSVSSKPAKKAVCKKTAVKKNTTASAVKTKVSSLKSNASSLKNMSSLKSNASTVKTAVKTTAKPAMKTMKKETVKKSVKPVASAEPFYGIRK